MPNLTLHLYLDNEEQDPITKPVVDTEEAEMLISHTITKHEDNFSRADIRWNNQPLIRQFTYQSGQRKYVFTLSTN